MKPDSFSDFSGCSFINCSQPLAKIPSCLLTDFNVSCHCFSKTPSQAASSLFKSASVGLVFHSFAKTSMFCSLIDVAIFLACSSVRSEEHTSELQSRGHLVCRLLLEKT